jgi:hypothetical protein
MLAIVEICIGLGTFLSKHSNSWSLPPPPIHPPSAAPTSLQWNLVGTIAKINVDSLGYNINFNHLGNAMAVASPRFSGSR